MAKKEQGDYVPINRVRKILNSSDVTITKATRDLNPPLNTSGRSIHVSEIERVREALEKYKEDLKKPS